MNSPRIRPLLLACLLLWPAAAFAQPSSGQGVEALCRAAADAASASLEGAKTFHLQLSAEGAALDLADETYGRCLALLQAEGRAPAALAGAERTVRLRLRAASSRLVALVTVASAEGVLAAQTVESPAGGALAAWLGAGGSGVETWVAGQVDGEVLALCGAQESADEAPVVALVLRDAVTFVRWRAWGFEPLARVELPASLRPRARAPGASALCRASGGAFEVAFGVHDRNRGGLVRLTDRGPSAIAPFEGIPIGTEASGGTVLAEGIAGTGLLRWKGRALASAQARPGPRGELRLVAVTDDGALMVGAQVGKAFTAGASAAVIDVDGDGRLELVRTRPLLPGSEAGDRLVIQTLDGGPLGPYESPAVKGLFGAVGPVHAPGHERALAVRYAAGRSSLYAVGTRLVPRQALEER